MPTLLAAVIRNSVECLEPLKPRIHYVPMLYCSSNRTEALLATLRSGVQLDLSRSNAGKCEAEQNRRLQGWTLPTR